VGGGVLMCTWGQGSECVCVGGGGLNVYLWGGV